MLLTRLRLVQRSSTGCPARRAGPTDHPAHQRRVSSSSDALPCCTTLGQQVNRGWWRKASLKQILHRCSAKREERRVHREVGSPSPSPGPTGCSRKGDRQRPRPPALRGSPHGRAVRGERWHRWPHPPGHRRHKSFTHASYNRESCCGPSAAPIQSGCVAQNTAVGVS